MLGVTNGTVCVLNKDSLTLKKLIVTTITKDIKGMTQLDPNRFAV